MSELATLARPYASAIFKRAKETSSSAKWSETLVFLSSVMASEELTNVLKNPKVNKSKFAEFLHNICQDHVDKEGINLLKLLIKNDRLALMSNIAKEFESLKADDEGYIEVDVVSAFPFTKEGEQKFTTTLEKKFTKKIHMNVTVDKSLIGGVLVRAGDQVIDGSIRGQLQQLQKALM